MGRWVDTFSDMQLTMLNTEETRITDYSQGKIACWPYLFFVHHPTPEGVVLHCSLCAGSMMPVPCLKVKKVSLDICKAPLNTKCIF